MAEPATARDWAVALFRRSVLKQRKLAEMARDARAHRRPALPRPRLRQRRRQPAAARARRLLGLGRPDGGSRRPRSARWSARTSTSSRGDRLPFADASFDRVAVVDMLEHVPDEAAFARELARVTRPGGRLVVNTPHLKRTLLRRLRHALGQTDEKHGHLRPGYTPRAAARAAGARVRDRAPPHLLALLLRGGRHRPQLGHRAARQEVLGQGHGGHGRRPRPPPQDVPRVLARSTRSCGR